jgi:hypothetical protein
MHDENAPSDAPTILIADHGVQASSVGALEATRHRAGVHRRSSIAASDGWQAKT